MEKQPDLAGILNTIRAQLQTLGEQMTRIEEIKIPNTKKAYKAEKKETTLVVEPKPPDHERDPSSHLNDYQALYGNHRTKQCQGRYKTGFDFHKKNIPKLLAFSGGSNPRAYQQWELNMDEYFEYHGVPRAERIGCCLSVFVGEAKRWWLREKDACWYYDDPTTLTWERLKKIMRRRFAPHYQPVGQPCHSKDKKTTHSSKERCELQGAYVQCKSSKPLEEYAIIWSNHDNRYKAKEKPLTRLVTLPLLELTMQNSKLEDNLVRTDYAPSSTCMMHLSCPKAVDTGLDSVDITSVMDQFRDVFPEKIPAWLPPKWGVELQFEHVLRAQSFAHSLPLIQFKEEPPVVVRNTLNFNLSNSEIAGLHLTDYIEVPGRLGVLNSGLDMSLLPRKLGLGIRGCLMVHTHCQVPLSIMMHLLLAQKAYCFAGARKEFRFDQWTKEKPPDSNIWLFGEGIGGDCIYGSKPRGKVDTTLGFIEIDSGIALAGSVSVLRTKPLEEGGNDVSLETPNAKYQLLVSVETQGAVTSSRAKALEDKISIFMQTSSDGKDSKRGYINLEIAWMIAWIIEGACAFGGGSVWTLLSHGREAHGVFTITQW